MKLSRIVAAVDFSELSHRAVEMAAEWATTFGGELHLAHVYRLQGLPMPDGAVMAGPGAVTEVMDEAQHRMQEVQKELSNRGISAETHLQEGSPSACLCELAKHLSADLIVLGTHGRSGVAHAILGSVAERVVRHAPCAVLTVR